MRSDSCGSDTAAAPKNYLLTVDPISSLIEARREGADVQRFRDSVAAMRSGNTQSLIVRLHTIADPLLLWATHMALDSRGVPPALRWPANEEDEQALYVTFSADLFWFCRRNPTHKARFRGWQGLFRHAPGSAAWHATAHRNFMFVQPRYSLAHWCSKGLDLSEQDRALLMTLPTNQMRADRRALEHRRFDEIERHLLDAALARPDKSKQHAPHSVAMRRAAMWRTYILSGRSRTLGAENWTRITGEALTRQAFTKQVNVVADVLGRAARGVEC